ncbi:MAG: hypothetical protein BM485_14760 [Desulfobulbaceae bacterium DB1]|nr:MAG: hypothetical protein BM485_14760 [Desulfobulbaceae bacterium DB1]
MSGNAKHHLLPKGVMRCFLAALLVFVLGVCGATVGAYQLQGFKWPQPSTTFYVDIPGAGGKWNDSFEEAMSAWGVGTAFDYNIVRGVSSDPCDPFDNRNGVSFNDTFCGEAWGAGTLAIEISYYIGSELIEADIVFNSNQAWNVYSTSWGDAPWVGVNDFQRVAVHELGHALGLGHENSDVPAIMRPWAGDITIPQQDDKNGVAALYGFGTVARPAGITVPSTDADGKYTVKWAASSTAGVTYVLQEATNSTFSLGLRTVYRGQLLSTPISGRVMGKTYYYRVKAIKSGYTASAWRVGANGCIVRPRAAAPPSIKVPVTDADGRYTVSWTASATSGVTYVLQEATNSTFSQGLRTAYSGPLLRTVVSDRVMGKTYYYRVRAVKSSYTASVWRVGTNGCRVP